MKEVDENLENKIKNQQHVMEEESSIYLICQNYPDYHVSSIYPSKNNNHSIIDLPPSYGMPSSFPSLYSLVTLDGKIYFLGGTVFSKPGDYYKGSSTLQRDVYCVDARSGYNHSWKRCSPMIVARYKPATMALNGMIYVFGGNSEKPWAEVFDSVAETWLPLPAPRSGFTEDVYDDLKGVAYCCGKFFIGKFGKEILLYDISSMSWETFSAPIEFNSFAVIDNIIYFCGWYGLYAYDFTKTIKFVGRIDCLEMFLEKLIHYAGEVNWLRGYVFQVGNGKLCLIGHERRLDHSVIVIKFDVVRYYDAEGQIFLRANVESSAVYDAKGELEDCFV